MLTIEVGLMGGRIEGRETRKVISKVADAVAIRMWIDSE
jgi:hypothetical protein